LKKKRKRLKMLRAFSEGAIEIEVLEEKRKKNEAMIATYNFLYFKDKQQYMTLKVSKLHLL